MKVRIKFTKTGDLRFIGHLDVMRYFQKLFRRAGIPVKYSEGFSPHPILSFSTPLPLGAESFGEYADVELVETVSSQEAIERMKACSVPEIEILSFKMLDEREENAMASVYAASYIVCPREVPSSDINFDAELVRLMSQDELLVTKTTKKNETTFDILPLIFEYEVLNAAKYETKLLLKAGSTNHIKPELVYEAIYKANGMILPERGLYIKRMDLYTKVDDKLVSLGNIGQDIQ